MNLFRKHDWVITVVTWVLVALSITTIYSITYSAESAIYGAGAANRQFIFALLGLVIYFGISLFIDYTYLQNKTILGIFYAVILGLLILVLVISQVNRGSVRWISIGPLNIEPSELAKILIILTATNSFAKRFKKILVFKDYLLSFLPIIPILVLVFIQPDLSTTLSLVFIVGIIFVTSTPNITQVITSLVVGGVSFVGTFLSIGNYEFFQLLKIGDFINSITYYRWQILIVLIILTIIIFIVFYNSQLKLLIFALITGIILSFGYLYVWDNVLSDYQKDRVNTFIHPEEDPLGSGYQVNQSIIATGSGQFWGRGFGRGTQSNLNFLPERHTDFIFASYAEEFGFVGSILIIAMYFILMVRIIQIGVSSKNPHGFLICIGVASMIFFQFTINIGMNIGLMPVTGITLPLFSYGGSSLLTTLLAISLVQSVSNGKELINIEDSLIIRDV